MGRRLLDGRAFRRPGNRQAPMANHRSRHPPERELEQERMVLFDAGQQRQGHAVRPAAQPMRAGRLGIHSPEELLGAVHVGASDPRVRRHHRRERHGHVRGRRGGAQERHHGRPLPAESQAQGTPQRIVSRVHDSVRQRAAEAPRQVRIHVPPPAGDSVRQAISGMRAQVHQGRLPEPSGRS